MAVLNLVLLRLMLASLVKAERATTAAVTHMAINPGCDASCGNLSIPYPFGMNPDCYLDKEFLITCNHSSNKAFLGPEEKQILVQEISLVDGVLRTKGILAKDCYNQTGYYTEKKRDHPSFNLTDWKGFTFSNTRNKLTVVGCNTEAFIKGSKTPERNYTFGCASICNSLVDVSNHSSIGIGFCQTSIPKELKKFDIEVKSFRNHTGILDFIPCSYTFLAEENSYKFSSVDLLDLENRFEVPLVIDWAIGNQTCEEARTRVCGENSYCYNNINGPGYRCNCKEGYEGNPYLLRGCQDINECLKPELHQCGKQAYCPNKAANPTCNCPSGPGRALNPKQIKVFQGIIGVVLLVLLGSSCLYYVIRKRKSMKLKEKFFQQNGGLMLQQLLSKSKSEGCIVTAKIFTAEELERATNNYSDDRILGKGGYGTVYMGTLEDNSTIAIKKPKLIDQSQIEHFINEVEVLSRINHRNVVKLLGCCLETQVPLLVYEFVNNGTLYDHIHNKGPQSSIISWEVRLRIAAETAAALAYLHSACSIPIIHRDVKSSNILLDDHYTAKVSDFGASRFIPLDQTQLTTLVQGTFGYIDPQYFQTSHLTEKSDVYSFGVLLVELLTGMKVLCFDRPEEERNLAMYFILSMREDRLFEILADGVVSEAPTNHLMQVAKLSMRCLELKGDNRPTMKEVAMELEGLRRSRIHPCEEIEQNPQDTQYQNFKSWGFFSEATSTTCSHSSQEILPFHITL